MLAAYLNRNKIVKKLLQYGANSNVADAIFGESPLYLAAGRGFNDVVQTLLKHDRSGINAKNNACLSVLDIALLKGHWDVVKSLVMAGAVITEQNFGLKMMPLLRIITGDKSGEKWFHQRLDKLA